MLSCWSCGEKFATAATLRNHHMSRPHRFMQVICPWCIPTKPFRRPVDLRIHVGREHRREVALQESGFPTLADCFYVAMEPRAYRHCVKERPSSGASALFIKEAVLKNPGTIDVERWQKGWDTHGPTSTLVYDCPSPLTRPYSPTSPGLHELMNISLTVSSAEVTFLQGSEVYKATFTVPDQRTRERFLRLMDTLKPATGVLPSIWQPCDEDITGIFKSYHLDGLECTSLMSSHWEPCSSPPKKKVKTTLEPLSPLRSPPDMPSLSDPDTTPPSSPKSIHTNSPLVPSSITEIIHKKKTFINPPSPKVHPRPAHETPMSILNSSRHDPNNHLAVPARSLLLSGGMPLFPPARRDWTKSSIELPLPEPLRTWPPKGWQSMEPDTRRLMLETVSTSMALKWGIPTDREFILDTFNFLALPGGSYSSSFPISSPEAKCRHSNLSTIIKISSGQKIHHDSRLLQMFQFASSKSTSFNHVGLNLLLEKCKDVPLRI